MSVLPHSEYSHRQNKKNAVRTRGVAKQAKWLAQVTIYPDAIFIEELRNTIDPDTKQSWFDLTSHAFAVFLPVKSVCLMGDGRTYGYVVALRAMQTSDFMTPDWAPLQRVLANAYVAYCLVPPAVLQFAHLASQIRSLWVLESVVWFDFSLNLTHT